MKTIQSNMIFRFFTLAFTFLVIVSCNNDENIEEDESCFEHFVYDDSTEEGPSNWGNACVSAGVENQCSSVESQSPINITGAIVDESLTELDFSGFNTTETEIINNGHTIQFNYGEGTTINFKGTTYSLLQFHFHASSEHTIDGNHKALEAHLVHTSDNNGLAVISVLFETGDENAFLAPFINNLPSEEDTEFSNDDLTYNVSDLLPTNKNYYNYNGSLTTPPCSEIVEWIIMETPVIASTAQINAFSAILNNNFRPIQPINGRTIGRFIN